MALRKCPRCELNYILDDGALCTVCREEVHGKKDDDNQVMLCSICGELPPLPGKDMCKDCLDEFSANDMASIATDTDGDDDDAIDVKELESEPVSSLDEIEALDDDEDMDEGLLDDEAEDAELIEEFAEAQ